MSLFLLLSANRHLQLTHHSRFPACSLKKNDKQDRNSIYYYFENSLLTRKDAECLVCENVTLSWIQVSQRNPLRAFPSPSVHELTPSAISQR